MLGIVFVSATVTKLGLFKVTSRRSRCRCRRSCLRPEREEEPDPDTRNDDLNWGRDDLIWTPVPKPSIKDLVEPCYIRNTQNSSTDHALLSSAARSSLGVIANPSLV